MMKNSYMIRYFDKNKWHFAGSDYFNPFDSIEEKMKNLKKIKEQFNIPDSGYVNVSNFFNVYL